MRFTEQQQEEIDAINADIDKEILKVANEADFKRKTNVALIKWNRTTDLLKKGIAKLNRIKTSLESVDKFVAADGQKWGIQVFPQNIPGTKQGVGLLLGLLTTSQRIFMDHHESAYSMIMQIDIVKIRALVDLIGSPAYFNKRLIEVVPEVQGDFNMLIEVLDEVKHQLGVGVIDTNITKEQYSNWFLLAKAKANVSLVAYKKEEEAKVVQS